MCGIETGISFHTSPIAMASIEIISNEFGSSDSIENKLTSSETSLMSSHRLLSELKSSESE